MIFESSLPPMGGRNILATLTYSDRLNKKDRKELHQNLVELLDANIDSRQMHDRVAKKAKNEIVLIGGEYPESILESMETEIGRSHMFTEIDEFILELLSNKFLSSYTTNY